MLLDLEDERIRASIRRMQDDRIKLVLEYPSEEKYRAAVREALMGLLRARGPFVPFPEPAE